MSETITPLPWWAGTDEDAHMVYGGEGNTVEAVASTLRDDGAAVIEEANARFIARACNAHDDLVSALRGVMATYCPSTEEGYSDIGGVVTRARAAIAKATGQKAGV